MPELDLREISTLKLETDITCQSCLTENILIHYRTTDLFNPEGFIDVSCSNCGQVLDMTWDDVKAIWNFEIERTKK